MHKLFITFGLNGILCDSKQIMNNMLKVSFFGAHEMNYDENFDTLIKVLVISNLIPTRGVSWARSLIWHTWSFGALCLWTTQTPVDGFISQELAKNFMILGQETCNKTHGHSSKIVTKVICNNEQHSLKVFISNLSESVSMFERIPRGCWPTPKTPSLSTRISPQRVFYNPPWKGNKNNTFLTNGRFGKRW